jgi:transcriptional regulator with XRE-family HTH domain
MKAKVNPQKIKEIREKRGWSQNQLADMAKVSLRTIQRMEKDGTCSIESVKSIAAVFEIDFKELLQEEKSKKNDDVDFLLRIEHGKQLTDLIGGKDASDFDFDMSVKDKKLIELIHSVFQSVSDYNDIWEEFEYGGAIRSNYFLSRIN